MSDSETGAHPLHRAIRGSEGGKQEECKSSLQVTRSSGWCRSVKQSWGISGFELESQGDGEAGERNQDVEGRHFQGQDTLVYLGHAEWGPGGQLDGACHWAAGCKLGPQDRGSSKEMDLHVAHVETMIWRCRHGPETLPKDRIWMFIIQVWPAAGAKYRS